MLGADTGSTAQLLKIPRALVADVVVGLNAVQTPLVLNNQADGDFEMWFVSIFRTDSRLKLLWEEGGSTRKFIYSGAQLQTGQFNGLFVANLAGLVANNGEFPIPVPYVLPPNRQVKLALPDKRR